MIPNRLRLLQSLAASHLPGLLYLLAIGSLTFACSNDKPGSSPSDDLEPPKAKDRSAWRIAKHDDPSKAIAAPLPVDGSPRAPVPSVGSGTLAQSPPPDRRLEPIPGYSPTHATLRLLRNVAEGDWDLSDLLSDKRGLIFVDNTDSPMKAKRYCGKDLGRASARAMRSFQDLLDRLEHEGAEIASCSNKPRPPTCRSTEHGHQGAIFFKFADGERGIELVAIYTLALSALTSLEGDALIKQERSTIAAADKELLRLSAEDCPGRQLPD